VIAALHHIGADLGEPIEVRRDGANVLVTATGLDPQRQEEVRSTLSSLAGVQVQWNGVRRNETHAELPPRRATPAPERANPLIAELQASLGGETSVTDLADQFIDHTDAAMARAYALRALARRFPEETVRSWNSTDTRILHEILRDHVEKLAASVETIHRLLAPVLPPGDAVPGSRPGWQGAAEAILLSLQQMDQSLNAGSSGSETSEARKARLAQALADLDQEIARLRRVVEP
jgi:hypothetical protein